MIKACIFDLDGTVMDTLSSIAYFVNTTLAELGFGEIEEEKFKYLVGNGRSKLLHRSLEIFDVDTDDVFEKACEIYDGAYENNFMYKTCAFEGIKEQITKLKEKGIKVAILSNKPDNVTRFIVEETFGKEFFDFVQGQIEGIPLKPTPESFLHIAKKLGTEPSESIMIGDTNVDIKTGHNAGAHTMGVLWGFRSREELESAGAEVIVESPKEIYEAVMNILDFKEEI